MAKMMCSKICVEASIILLLRKLQLKRQQENKQVCRSIKKQRVLPDGQRLAGHCRDL